MRKKRIVAGMAFLCMVTGSLAGCGANGEATSDGTVSNGGSYTALSKADGGSEEWKLSGGGSVELPASAGAEGGYMDSADIVPGEPILGEYSKAADTVSTTEKVEVEEVESVGIEEEILPGNMVEPQAGLLTGGEWRDNENWGFFVNLVQTGRFGFQTFGIKPYERVVVQALADGEPAGQIRVRLNTASGSTIATAVTDHNGKAYLYYNVYGGSEEADHVVLIKSDGSSVQVNLVEEKPTGEIQTQGTEQGGGEASDGREQESLENQDGQVQEGLENFGNEQEAPLPVHVGEAQNQGGTQQTENGDVLRSTELTVELGETVPSIRALDVMFVFDTTGSMGDELLYLQKEFEDIASRVADQSTRFSVNFYRDHGDEYVVRSNPFSDDIKATAALINAEYANGGGDYEEAVDEALLDAVMGHTWREEAVKLMFLVLDAPPHDTGETAENLKAALDGAMAQGIRIIPIAASGVDEKTEAFLRSIAMLTGGTYTFLTDDSGIGGSHLEPTVGAYTVEALNNMIVRLIEEYYGK